MSTSTLVNPQNADNITTIDEKLAGKITALTCFSEKAVISFRQETLQSWNMAIQFNNAKTGLSSPYHYVGIPESLIIEFLFAPSPLSLYHRKIKGERAFYPQPSIEEIT